MDRFGNKYDLPPAIGQVVTMAFQENRTAVQSINGLDTVLIIKPNAKFPVSYYKFPGGMLRKGETLAQAALRELTEETGVIPSQNPDNLVELCRVKKPRHAPHTGEFDIAFFAAYGCDFSTMNDPKFGDVGDEAEESMVANFSEIGRPNHLWPIETLPGRAAAMFPFHIELLKKAAMQRLSATA